MNKKKESKEIKQQKKSRVIEKYGLLDSSLTQLSKDVISLLLLVGEAGMGKTRTTLEYLKKDKISHAYISCYTTPLSFYELLYKHKDKQVLVIDDIEGLGDEKVISMLKSACWRNTGNKKIVSYNSTTKLLEELELPTSFELKANLVLIFNKIPNNFKAVVNRGIKLDFNFNFEEKIEIFDLFKDKAQIDEKVAEHLRLSCSNATKNLSIRTAVILSKLKSSGAEWLKFAEEILETDEEEVLLIQKVAKSHDLKCACASWCEETGHHRATFYRKYKRLGGKKY
ncbi:MAG: hypothetical protein ACP5D2_03850, partial [Candidatus Nanoarchaeia archaeon]